MTRLYGCRAVIIWVIVQALGAVVADAAAGIALLDRELTIAPHGGIPFTADLDGDGAHEILWLQSPGLFHSRVFDKPPWNGYITDAERDHFCLTATRPDGQQLWQIGEPWPGDRPFITHCAERAVDAADIDGDGRIEVVCVRGGELLVLDGLSGAVERKTAIPADNGQIVRLAHTGAGPKDWTILVKNSESAYAPHEYANPAWFYTPELDLIKTADFLGAGHAPLVQDLDGDGIDEFIIGFNRVSSDLKTVWTYSPVPPEAWDAAELHVDDVFAAEVAGRLCIALAASDTAYLLDATDGSLIWKYKGTHPQHCQIGEFDTAIPGNEIFVHNKRAELQLFDATGKELWNIMPPKNFPLGEPEAVKGHKYHVFDPTEVLRGLGPNGTDLLIFTDGGWPYLIDGAGRRTAEFAPPPNSAQDWSAVPARPDDYGYGFYARVADFDGDGDDEVLLNDRRYAWFYEIGQGESEALPRSAGEVLHVDFENYTDGVVQALNAGVRWLGDPFSNRNEGAVEVTRDFGYGGARSAHVASDAEDQIARVRLQPRYDAPVLDGDEVIEFLFRPVRDGGANLRDFTIWSAGGSSGITLIAVGEAASGTYSVDVVHPSASTSEQSSRTQTSLSALPQDAWTRFVMHRKRDQGMVTLWAGAPGAERFVGDYPDRNAARPTDSIDPIAVGTQKQLFADDVLIESAEGLVRTLHPIKKHPDNPLVVPDKPWEGLSVLLYGSVLRDADTGKFRMWYLAWGKHVGKPTSICYAESDDGLHWTKPNLGIQEFEGSMENNILMPGWSQTTILYDPRDPDATQRYKAVLRMNGTRAFLSPDGLHWRDAGTITDQAYDATTVQWNPIDQKWFAMVKIFKDGKRARGYAESDDFLNWTDTYYLGTVDERDAPGDQMYGIYPFAYEGMLFGHLRMYHTDTDKVDIQLVTSRNGKQWNRDIRTTFIPCSEEVGAWDYGNNSTPTSAPVRVGDELWFYYAGRSTLHDEVPNTGAIGLGTLRVDGFFSMDAGPEGGVLTTHPVVLTGERLFVNANAAGGRLSVEILDGTGRPIDGYEESASAAVMEDSIHIPLQWADSASLAPLKHRTVRLRFHLKDAALYSFWME